SSATTVRAPSTRALLIPKRDPGGELSAAVDGRVADLVGDAFQVAARHDQHDPLPFGCVAEHRREDHSLSRTKPLTGDPPALRSPDDERDLRPRTVSVGHC